MNLHHKKLIIYPVIFFIIALSGCVESENNSVLNDPDNSGYSYNVPEQTDDGWQTASLLSVNLASDLIEEMVPAISAGDLHNQLFDCIIPSSKFY